ncbi:MAG: biopolymer transporter ExbD [Ignavibacteriales bacterium]|nr:biopolymer transporter ExbD [Ignavibacteriales bacterium]
MVKLKKRNRGSADIPTSSMADIAFLLLIFFLVSTTIDVDTGIGLVLPEWVPEDEKVEVKIGPDRLITLNINEFGDVLLNNEVFPVPRIKDNLIERIRSKIELPAEKKLIVSVKTDRKTNYNLYIQAIDQVKAAYFQVREEYALSKWGKKLYEIKENSEEEKELRDKIPISISIAEPQVVK